jgi:hypothetical protein
LDFYSSELYLLFWGLHLAEKFRNIGACIPISPLFSTNFQEASSVIFNIERGKRKHRPDIEVSPKYKKILRTCLDSPKIRFIIVNIVWRKLDRGESYETHMGFMFVDKKNKAIEVYDPHGGEMWIEDFEKSIPDVLRALSLPKYKLYSGTELCPRLAYQSFEDQQLEPGDYEGFCASWALWLIEMRLSNPDVPRDKLPYAAMQAIAAHSASYRKFIRDYTRQIEEFGKLIKNKVGLTFKKPKKVSDPFTLDKDNTKKLEDYILKQYKQYRKNVKA